MRDVHWLAAKGLYHLATDECRARVDRDVEAIVRPVAAQLAMLRGLLNEALDGRRGEALEECR